MKHAIKCILLATALLILVGLQAKYHYAAFNFNKSEKSAERELACKPAEQQKKSTPKQIIAPAKQQSAEILSPDEDQPDIFIANDGNDNNPGTTTLPKKTIDGSEAAITAIAPQASRVIIGLKANNLFREQLDADKGVILKTFHVPGSAQGFARISGMQVHNSGWTPSPGRTDLYEKKVAHEVSIYSPNYNFLLIYEIDTLLEKTAPFSARRMMPMAASVYAANNTNGSYYTDQLDSPSEMIYINTSDNAVPGTGRYRYEITARDFAVHADAQLEKLIVEPSGHGYGNGFGDSTLIRQCIFNGYGTHAVVFYSGSIEHNLFLQGTKGLAQGSIPIVNYETEGAGNRSTFSGNIFYETQTGPFAHQGGGSSSYIDEVVYTDNSFFGEAGYSFNAFGTTMVKSVIVKDNYATDAMVFWNGIATDLLFEHNIFNNISGRSGISNPVDLTARTIMRNNLIKTSGNSSNQSPFSEYTTVFSFVNSRVSIDASNNIFHLKTDWDGIATPAGLFATPGANTKFSRNIIICDVPPGRFASVASVDKNAIGNFAADSNVYVIVRGEGFLWSVANSSSGNTSVTSFSDWKAESGRDAASIVIDLRDNPNGLKDLFADPARGNYQFAHTKEADTAKALMAGMITPPFAFPLHPTKEAAAQSIMELKPAPDCSKINIAGGNAQLHISGLAQAQVVRVIISDISSGTKVFEQDFIQPSDAVNIPLPGGRYAAKVNFFTLSGKPLCEQSFTRTLAEEPAQLVESNVGIAPNPFQNAFTITIKSENDERVDLSLWDLSGRRLTAKTAQLQKGSNRISIEGLGHLMAGSYFLRVSSSQGVEHFKLLKK
ncbi:MAG: T9SS type A sorting domain-containing protein [Chitinophagaceae bacterium]